MAINGPSFMTAAPTISPRLLREDANAHLEMLVPLSRGNPDALVKSMLSGPWNRVCSPPHAYFREPFHPFLLHLHANSGILTY